MMFVKALLPLLPLLATATGTNSGTDAANATSVLLLEDQEYTLELNHFNGYSYEGEKY